MPLPNRLRHARSAAALLLLASSACAASRTTRGIVSMEDPRGAVAAEVVDAGTGEPVPGAALWIPGSDAMSDDTLPTLAGVIPGRWTVHADAPGYEAAEARVAVAARDTARVRIALRRTARVAALANFVVVRGRVFDPRTGDPIAQATVVAFEVPGPGQVGAVTASDGTYRVVIPVERLRGLARLQLRASRLGMATQRRTVPLRPGEELVVDFRITPRAIH